MGMDLITVAWTTDLRVNVDSAALTAYIEALPAETLLQHADTIDSTGVLHDGYDDEPLEGLLRATLLAGAEVLVDSDSLRLCTTYDIPGTPLVFTIAGGGSWGDDPFDGFTDLTRFIEACRVLPDLARLVGFVDAGIPHAEQIAYRLTPSAVDDLLDHLDGRGLVITEPDLIAEALRERDRNPDEAS